MKECQIFIYKLLSRRCQSFDFLGLKKFSGFNFEGYNDVLKSKISCILLNKNINFNKNERESKMENFIHSFRETNLVLQLI